MLGLNPYLYKLGAFVLSAFLAAGAGVVYLLLQGGAHPQVTTADFTLAPLVMVVLGGVGTLWGAVLGGIVYAWYSFLLVAVAILAGGLLWLFVNRTHFGRLVVAVIYDPEISTAIGVNVPRVYVVAFTLGAVLATLGGAFTAPMIAVVPGISVEVIVLAFAVVVIGGLGSMEGAALGALIVGLVRAAAVHLMPALELFTIYLVMALVLLVRPHGLFAQEEVRRI